LAERHPERLHPLGDAQSQLPASTLFTGCALLHLYYWCTNQFIVQRAFGARSLSQGQKGVLFAASMKLVGPFYLILPGVMAFHLFPDQVGADGNLAYSTLVRNLLPKPLLGFFAAAIFGAILSTFNSALNSCATLFSVDLVKGFLYPAATDHQMVRIGKLFGAVLAIIVITAAPLIEGQGPVFNLMKQVAATFDVPLMAIVFVGILSRRTPAMAPLAAVIVGVAFYVTITFVFANQLWGYTLHWLHVAGLNFALMMLVMGAFRLLAPSPGRFEQAYTRQVDISPWPAAKPVSFLIATAVVLIYLGLYLAARS
jgi:SSS family solute:Na+ symporter